MNAEEIHSRLSALREAGRELRQRSAREVLSALGEVLERWSDASSRWRRELELELPKVTGFTAPVVEKGLEVGLSRWRGAALRDLSIRELGPLEGTDAGVHHIISGFPTTSVILAGAIPMPSLLSILAPLVLRSPVLVKSASRDTVTPRLVAESIADIDGDLGRCVDIVDFPGADDGCIRAFVRAECVVATGSDESVTSIARRMEAHLRFVGYGHRLSVAAVAGTATRGATLHDVTQRLALDVALWDQLGCLSPVSVFVPDSGAADRVAEALAEALAEMEERLPRGAIDSPTKAAIAQERGDAEMRAAAGRRVTLYTSTSTSWTVVREDTADIRPAPLHRFVRVLPVADVSGFLTALTPLGPHLAAVSIEGFGARESDLSRALADLGASRLCRAGQMQSPPLGWRHDNRGVLTPLARFTDVTLG